VSPYPSSGGPAAVVLRNNGGQTADLTGWKLTSGEEGKARGARPPPTPPTPTSPTLARRLVAAAAASSQPASPRSHPGAATPSLNAAPLLAHP